MLYAKVNQAARKTLNPVHVGVSTRAVSVIPAKAGIHCGFRIFSGRQIPE
jgi:hypothetical protein